MTDETRLAFLHPSERAAATAPDGRPPDRISLRDHIVQVEIGAFQQERGHRQRVCFNVVVEVAPPTGAEDDVDRILSYDHVTEAIAAELGAERINLLETLAARVAARILREPQALRVFVRIEKLDRGPGALGVEIVRARDTLSAGGTEGRGAQDAHGGQDGPHPQVIYLSNEAIAAPGLGRWIDRLPRAVPVILCVGMPEAAVPRSGAAQAQRRIDLLAMEQNAWVLAGRDPRCIVTGTRTELDWAMRHGQVSVWAPTKIVLDSVDGPAARPPVDPRDPGALAAWFAGLIGAAELLVIGAEAPSAPVPVRSVGVDALA